MSIVDLIQRIDVGLGGSGEVPSSREAISQYQTHNLRINIYVRLENSCKTLPRHVACSSMTKQHIVAIVFLA